VLDAIAPDANPTRPPHRGDDAAHGQGTRPTCQDWAVNPVERLLGAVINPVVDAVDVDGVVSKVDVDRLISEVDLDKLMASIDVDALLARIDIDALLDRIDVDALVARIDLDQLTGRLDVQALIERIDLNALLAEVDLDPLLAKVDVAGLAKRAGIDDIVSDATRGVTKRILDMARRQIVGLDLIVSGIWARIARRPRPEPPRGATATGAVAGPVSRLLAYFVDIAAITFGFSVITSVVSYLVQLFFGENVDTSPNGWGWLFGLGYVAFAFVYWMVGLTLVGSSIGKALLGMRVVRTDGTPLKGRQGLVRTVVYPFSFILGLGLIPIVTARSHRALHDKAAGTKVLYDWGDGDQFSKSPLTRWLRGRSQVADEWIAPAVMTTVDTPSAPATSIGSSVPAVGVTSTGTTSANGTATNGTAPNGSSANGAGTAAKPAARSDR
jgi:uncharacterized RDD family membrane protein YckC